jgi:hypothetical protein
LCFVRPGIDFEFKFVEAAAEGGVGNGELTEGAGDTGAEDACIGAGGNSALVLRQMDHGRSTVEAGAGVGISAKVAWKIGKRYRGVGCNGPFTTRLARAESHFWMASRASASLPWCAVRRRRGGRVGRCG